MAYFREGSKWGVKIEYSLEDTPLGTMGPLKLLRDLPEEFLVMNGDVLSDMDYSLFLEEHIKSKEIFSVASYRRIQKVDYGVLEGDGNVLKKFNEKPEFPFVVSMGIYAVSNNIMQYIPDNQYFGFDMLMMELLDKGIKVRTQEYEGYWMDIGRPDDYQQAVDDVESGKFTY